MFMCEIQCSQGVRETEGTGRMRITQIREDIKQSMKGGAEDRRGVNHTNRSSSSMSVGSSLCMAIFCSWLLYLTSQMPGGSRMPPLDCLSAYIYIHHSVIKRSQCLVL